MVNLIKSKVSKLSKKTTSRIASVATCVAYAMLCCMSLAFADGDASGLIKVVLVDILSKLVFVIAVVFIAMGSIGWAAANAEGDGPAKHKATMQLASGGMLALLGTILVTQGDTLAGMISS